MGNPELKTRYHADLGFLQFVERHELIAEDPKARKEYEFWLNEQLLWARERALLEADAIIEGIAKGRAKVIAKGRAEAIAEVIAEGEAKAYLKVALKAFQKARPGEDLSIIAQSLIDDDIPPDIIQNARELVESKR